MDIEMAEVTAIVSDKVKVKFNQDEVESVLEYPKLSSYRPTLGDKVLMLRTNTSFICIGGVGHEPAGVSAHVVGEYKFFAKDKGLMWSGWAKCDGRELSIETYPELYAEIGTEFSASGNHFLLPSTTGRVLSDASGEVYGAVAGAKTVALTTSEMPSHTHMLNTSKNEYGSGSKYVMQASTSAPTTTSDGIRTSGRGDAHENRQPTLYGGYYYIYTGVM